jgi:hypothetical protein
MMKRVLRLPGVAQVKTNIALQKLKQSHVLPLDHLTLPARTRPAADCATPAAHEAGPPLAAAQSGLLADAFAVQPAVDPAGLGDAQLRRWRRWPLMVIAVFAIGNACLGLRLMWLLLREEPAKPARDA